MYQKETTIFDHFKILRILILTKTVFIFSNLERFVFFNQMVDSKELTKPKIYKRKIVTEGTKAKLQALVTIKRLERFYIYGYC